MCKWYFFKDTPAAWGIFWAVITSCQALGFPVLLFLYISICSSLSLFHLSYPLVYSFSPPCRAVVSLQPPQSSPHRESWRRSKPSLLSPGWVTSNLTPQALLQACGPESWQLREPIVRERLTTHGSFCKTHTHTHTHPHTKSGTDSFNVTVIV